MELPIEDYQPGDEDKCGLLQQSLYGTRDAAANWERELSGFLYTLGFTQGRGSLCLHHNKELGACAAVHGDDVTVAVSRKGAEKLLQAFQKKYEVKSQMMGGDPDLAKEAAVLNRRLQWTREGIKIEADPRHAQEVIKALGMERANPIGTPMATDGTDNDDSEEARGKLLEGEEATRYRAVAARLNYLTQDRMDLAVATLKAVSYTHLTLPTKA